MLAEKKTENTSTKIALSKPGKNSRQQIIEASARLFAQKGFSGATTREIARMTETSESNIFRHFANKDALYAAVFDEKGKELTVNATLGKLRRFAAEGDDRAVFHELMKSILSHHRHNRDLIRMIMFGTLEGNQIAKDFAGQLLQPVREFLTHYIAERQQTGVFRACNVRAMVRAILGMPSQHAMTTELLHIDSYEVSDIEAIETFTQTALDTLCVSCKTENQKTEVEENV
jgi:TetR/AcrR family transcriptional regulator